MLYVKSKDLTVPGMLLAEGDYMSEDGTHREKGKSIRASWVLCMWTEENFV